MTRWANSGRQVIRLKPALPLDCLAGSTLFRSDVEDRGSSRDP
jgi:hypothetical protein